MEGGKWDTGGKMEDLSCYRLVDIADRRGVMAPFFAAEIPCSFHARSRLSKGREPEGAAGMIYACGIRGCGDGKGGV